MRRILGLIENALAVIGMLVLFAGCYVLLGLERRYEVKPSINVCQSSDARERYRKCETYP